MTTEDFNIENLEEFDSHKLVSFVYDCTTGLKGIIAIHRGNSKHPAFGATRFWEYKSEIDALKDALKLSRTMSYKAALAGLNYGGAKGVIIKKPGLGRVKRKLLRTYAQRVNYLGGHFITGADVGIDEADVKTMRRVSPYMVGVESDPVRYTALGVYYSIQVCLEELFGSKEVKERSFAIQGLGKIGMSLLSLLFSAGCSAIFVADIDKSKVRVARKKFPGVKIVESSHIHKQDVDVFSPCALSDAINQKNVLELKCRIIVGGANNQIEDNELGVKLHNRGILYAPDYVVNAGGLISVVDEYENKNHKVRRVEKRVSKIRQTLRKILSKSKKQNRATNLVANEIAEKIFNSFI